MTVKEVLSVMLYQVRLMSFSYSTTIILSFTSVAKKGTLKKGTLNVNINNNFVL